MRKQNLAKKAGRNFALRSKGKQIPLVKEIPHYLQILATARRHGVKFASPVEAYKKIGISIETATQLEITRLKASTKGKLNPARINALAKDIVSQTYNIRIPDAAKANLK
jgi:hypothetical protein